MQQHFDSTLSVDDDEPDPADGLMGGRYRVIGTIGRGGAGEVLEALDIELGIPVAIKLLHTLGSDARAIARLKREVQLARKITHENVCRTYDFGQHRMPDGQSTPYLTMELVEGETLSAAIHRRKRFDTAEALPIARQLASALDAAHAAGVVHGDFKSGNVVVAGKRAVVMDFGLSLELGAQHDSRASSLVGSPAYMAPEQIEGQPASPAADIYAFGVVLYEMVTGERPFDGDTPMATALRRYRGPPPSPSLRVRGLDRRWTRAICRCLALDPARRPRSGAEVLRLLERRTWIAKAAVATAAAIVIVLTAGIAWQSMGGEPPQERPARAAAPPLIVSWDAASTWAVAELEACDGSSARVRFHDGNVREVRTADLDRFALSPGDEVASHWGDIIYLATVLRLGDAGLVELQWNDGSEDAVPLRDLVRVNRPLDARPIAADACTTAPGLVLVHIGVERTVGALEGCTGEYATVRRANGDVTHPPVSAIAPLALAQGEYLEPRWHNGHRYGATVLSTRGDTAFVRWESGGEAEISMSTIDRHFTAARRGDPPACPR